MPPVVYGLPLRLGNTGPLGCCRPRSSSMSPAGRYSVRTRPVLPEVLCPGRIATVRSRSIVFPIEFARFARPASGDRDECEQPAWSLVDKPEQLGDQFGCDVTGPPDRRWRLWLARHPVEPLAIIRPAANRMGVGDALPNHPIGVAVFDQRTHVAVEVIRLDLVETNRAPKFRPSSHRVLAAGSLMVPQGHQLGNRLRGVGRHDPVVPTLQLRGLCLGADPMRPEVVPLAVEFELVEVRPTWWLELMHGRYARHVARLPPPEPAAHRTNPQRTDSRPVAGLL